GFTFVPDGQTPQFTTGRVANGALTIDVGGVNNDDVTNMIGAFTRDCNSASAGAATIRLTKSLAQTSEYESNEISQLALRVNGEQTIVFDEIVGDGNGGNTQSTGVQTEEATVNFRQGSNTLELICF